MIKLAGFVREGYQNTDCGTSTGERNYLRNYQHFKTIPTYHDKIMIAEEIQDEYESYI
jgi:hypothetical protein